MSTVRTVWYALWYWMRTGHKPMHWTDPGGWCSHQPQCSTWYQHNGKAT